MGPWESYRNSRYTAQIAWKIRVLAANFPSRSWPKKESYQKTIERRPGLTANGLIQETPGSSSIEHQVRHTHRTLRTKLQSTAFAEPGDLGSFVYTTKGEVIGMLIERAERTDTYQFQHITDVFEATNNEM